MFEAIVNGINTFFTYYLLVYIVVFFMFTVSSLLDFEKSIKRKKFDNNIRIRNKNNYIPVSVLIPAYNEEMTIVSAVESILYSAFPEYEIIIINDGSKDKTKEKLLEAFNFKLVKRPIRKLVECNKETSIYEAYHKNVKLTLINKINGGKADALNMGINVSKYPLFVALDADSVLEKSSLTEIVKPFMEDDTTIAIGGNIKIANDVILKRGIVEKVNIPKKFLVIMQNIEYFRVFLTTRVWFNKFNGNLIISGAFGLFKKEAVVNVGGYNSKSIGEDMELVVKLHSYYRKNKIPYKIGYSYDAICWSQAPEALKDLKGQRKRWQKGLISSILEHRYMLLNFKYGFIGIFSFLYFLMFEMLSCIIQTIGIIVVVLSYLTGITNIRYFSTFMVLYISYSSIISIASIILENYIFKHTLTAKGVLKLCIFSVVESFGYRQFCDIQRLIAYFEYAMKKNDWGKIERKAQN